MSNGTTRGVSFASSTKMSGAPSESSASMGSLSSIGTLGNKQVQSFERTAQYMVQY